MPMAAVTQMEAAVVKTCTSLPVRRIAPAPRNPTPVTTWAAMRVGSVLLLKTSRPSPEKRQAPTPTRPSVLMPAGCPCHSRSTPRAIARMAVTNSRSSKSGSPVSARDSAPSRSAGLVRGSRLVREFGQGEAVDKVAEDGQTFFVDRRLALLLVAGLLVGVRDDACRLHHL